MLSKQHHVWLDSPCHMHKISVTQLHFSNRYAEWVKAKYNIISSSLFSGKEPHTHIQIHPQHAQENFYLWILLTSCMYGSKCISVCVCVCVSVHRMWQLRWSAETQKSSSTWLNNESGKYSLTKRILPLCMHTHTNTLEAYMCVCKFTCLPHTACHTPHITRYTCRRMQPKLVLSA